MAKVRYTKELLEELLKRDNAELLEDYKKVNANTKLKFKCKCGEIYEKSFFYLYTIKDNFLCRECTSKNKVLKSKETNLNIYGGWPFQNKEIQDKIKATNIQKYGCENPFQNKNIKDKIKATNIEKYGCKSPIQNKEIQDKIKATNIQKYGCENPFQNKEVRNKFKENYLEKYGCENPFQNEDIKNKTKITNIEKYGVEHPAQNAEISDKSSKTAYKSKEYFLPSGKLIKVQGKENIALDNLLCLYKEDEIITSRKEVPKIWWEDKEGKKHRYFADIFIPKENRIIEVKSTWTFSQDNKKEKIEKVPIVSTNSGYKYEYWIYDNKDNKEVKKFY